MTFNDEREFLKRVEDSANPQNQREQLTAVQLRELLMMYPNLPTDFIDYLREIGSGSFRECQFNVAASLYTLDELGLQHYCELHDGIVFFGDNYAGNFAGFHINDRDGFVVEFWHEDGTLYQTNQLFKEYIREQMLMDSNGNDARATT